jgi:hypothetical protein
MLSTGGQCYAIGKAGRLNQLDLECSKWAELSPNCDWNWSAETDTLFFLRKACTSDGVKCLLEVDHYTMWSTGGQCFAIVKAG